MSAPRPLPLVPGRPLVGNLPELRRDPIGLMLRGVAQHGDIVVFPVANRRLTVLRSPEHVKHVLVDQVKSYSKQTRGYDALRLVLGQGLVTSEGDFWLPAAPARSSPASTGRRSPASPRRWSSSPRTCSPAGTRPPPGASRSTSPTR